MVGLGAGHGMTPPDPCWGVQKEQLPPPWFGFKMDQGLK